jgi:hypothetical protein
MAITYTNNQEVISDALYDLLFAEFKPIHVALEKSFNQSNMTHGRYIRYWFNESTEEAKHSDGETRNYEIEIVFYFDESRYRTRKAFDNYWTERSENLRKLLINSSYYSVSGSYKWHNLVQTQSPFQTVEELEDIEDEKTQAIKFDIVITRSNFS